MTTAERLYRSFMAVTTPRERAVTPFSVLKDHRRESWEDCADAYAGMASEGYSPEQRLYYAIWDETYLVPWEYVDGATRVTWRRIAEAFLALEQEGEAA